jgi:pre-rRNA-processing protein TSR1
MGPLTWGPVPTLFFKHNAVTSNECLGAKDGSDDLRNSDEALSYQLVGTGTSLPPSLTRVIAKRIILTGHPFKIHKKLVTVRYMFFNREDVEWFSALQLWTKRGRIGYIKESLGMHGYFKATFDGRVNPLDSIGVSLYKRIWPRRSVRWNTRLSSVNGRQAEA